MDVFFAEASAQPVIAEVEEEGESSGWDDQLVSFEDPPAAREDKENVQVGL